jgi:hypothetical protein
MLGGGIATLRSGLTLRCGSTGVVACVTPYTSAYRLCAQQPKRVVEEGCSTKSIAGADPNLRILRDDACVDTHTRCHHPVTRQRVGVA